MPMSDQTTLQRARAARRVAFSTRNMRADVLQELRLLKVRLAGKYTQEQLLNTALELGLAQLKTNLREKKALR